MVDKKRTKNKAGEGEGKQAVSWDKGKLSEGKSAERLISLFGTFRKEWTMPKIVSIL